MVYLGLPINSMVIFHGELLNNQRLTPVKSGTSISEIDGISTDLR
jgi:hypothetical protein